MKICRICGSSKIENSDNFYFRSDTKKFKNDCISCCLLIVKKNYCKNIEIIKRKDKIHYDQHKERILAQQKVRYNQHKERIIAQQREYLKTHPEAIKKRNKYASRRSKYDVSFKLRRNVSAQIRRQLKKLQVNKKDSILNCLPYTISDLKLHLEKQFESWMNWDNWGIYNSKIWNDNDPTTWTWNIDHIIPHSTFEYISMEDGNFKKCWSLDNLRPLSSKINVIEGVNQIRHRKEFYE